MLLDMLHVRREGVERKKYKLNFDIALTECITHTVDVKKIQCVD